MKLGQTQSTVFILEYRGGLFWEGEEEGGVFYNFTVLCESKECVAATCGAQNPVCRNVTDEGGNMPHNWLKKT